MAPRTLTDPGRLMAILREERLAQELTLEWVAKKVGVTHQSIQIFETEREGKVPTEATLRKWLAALQLPEEWTDLWIEHQIGEKVRDLLAARRGPRAASPEDIEAAVRYVRRIYGR